MDVLIIRANPASALNGLEICDRLPAFSAQGWSGERLLRLQICVLYASKSGKIRVSVAISDRLPFSPTGSTQPYLDRSIVRENLDPQDSLPCDHCGCFNSKNLQI